jgi:NAD+ kinase
MQIACIASNINKKAIILKERIKNKYNTEIIFIDELSEIKDMHLEKKIDSLIVLGGDGFMIRVLQILLLNNLKIDVYGINCGHLGFLMNDFFNENKDLIEKINNADRIYLNPLKIKIKTKDKKEHEIFGINEISLLRQTYQSIHINIFVNDILEIEDLSGDGVLIATPAGSAAYNKSAGGSILPMSSDMVCLTAINPFRPRGWKSAILPDETKFKLYANYSKDRPALACADFQQYYFVDEVTAYIEKNIFYTLLFDQNSHIEKKIMKEQFYLCS